MTIVYIRYQTHFDGEMTPNGNTITPDEMTIYNWTLTQLTAGIDIYSDEVMMTQLTAGIDIHCNEVTMTAHSWDRYLL